MNYGGGQSPADSGEVEALKFFRDSFDTSKPFTLFDVGANDGEYLSHALDALGSDLNAYSFEPQSESYARLDKRFANDPRVKTLKVALGGKVGTAELFSAETGDATASLHRNNVFDQTSSELVQVTTVDQVCADEGIEQIDFLKIDTEGNEMDVLLGASNTIEAGRVSAIQFEFGDPYINTQYHFIDLWKLLSPRHTIYRILRHGLVALDSYSTDLEIYKIANFICVKRQ